MKWCIIVSEAPFLMEFLGKLTSRLLKQGDECVLLLQSKFAEYDKLRHFPAKAHWVSKADWLLEHYDPSRRDYENISCRPPYANFDRLENWPWGYEPSRRRLAQDEQFFEHVFTEECPDAILFEPPTGTGAEIAYALSVRYGIPYLGITDARIAGRLEIKDSEYTDRRFCETFERLRLQDISQEELRFARRFIRYFLGDKQLSLYYGNTGTVKIRFTPFGYIRHYVNRLREIGRPLLRYFWERPRFKDVDFESENRFRTAFRAPGNLIVRQLRIVFQKDFYQRANRSDEFYLFPLHVQPEASTSVQAMEYSDQAATIRNVAFQLPFPCKLYVKENANAVGSKADSFYQKIQNIPNTVLIVPYESIEELIGNCHGVITLTGTAGMEAAMRGKPAYALGNVFYEYHPLCRNPRNMDELRLYILRDRKRGVARENLADENIRFVVSYLRNTIPGDIGSAIEQRDKNNYGQIARDLRKLAAVRKRSMRKKPAG